MPWDVCQLCLGLAVWLCGGWRGGGLRDLCTSIRVCNAMCRLGGVCVVYASHMASVGLQYRGWLRWMDTSALPVLLELQELPMGNTCISSWGGGDDVPRRGCAARVMVGARTFRVGWKLPRAVLAPWCQPVSLALLRDHSAGLQSRIHF